MRKNIIKIVNIVLIITFVIILCPKSMQNDTFWSIKIGQELVEEGIKKVDDWSIHSDLKYVAHHLLTDVLIYFAYSIGGFFALYILEIVLALIIVGLFYILNKELTGNSKISYFFLYFQMYLFMPFIAVRAQMVSTIVFLIQFIMLEKIYKEYKHRYVVILTLLPLVLANFHMGVLPFYFVIIGVYTLSSFITINKFMVSQKNVQLGKKFLLIFFAGILLSFINPYGIDGVIYGIKTLLSDTITYNIMEFQPLTINNSVGIGIFIYILISVFIIYRYRENLLLKDVLLYLGTLFMACVSARYVQYFTMFSAVILCYLKKIKLNLSKPDIMALNAVMYTVLPIIIFIFAGPRINNNQYVDENKYPVEAYENVKEYFDENARIFNDYVWGSYLMLNNEKVFIDSRLDLYTEEYNKNVTVFKDYLDIEKRYNEIIKKYNINMFFVKADEALATMLSLDERFKLVYEDDVAVVYVNNSL